MSNSKHTPGLPSARGKDPADMDTTELQAAVYALKENNVELRAALEKLIDLHHNWFRGSAYVTVRFEEENNAAIAQARAAIAKEKINLDLAAAIDGSIHKYGCNALKTPVMGECNCVDIAKAQK